MEMEKCLYPKPADANSLMWTGTIANNEIQVLSNKCLHLTCTSVMLVWYKLMIEFIIARSMSSSQGLLGSVSLTHLDSGVQSIAVEKLV